MLGCGTYQAVGGTLHDVLNGDLDEEFLASLLNNRRFLRRVARRNREIGQRRRLPRTFLFPQVMFEHDVIQLFVFHGNAWAYEPYVAVVAEKLTADTTWLYELPSKAEIEGLAGIA